jgi:hypothetical protein
MSFVINDEHFEYLSIQRGEISDHRHDRKAWERAYAESIGGIVENVRPHLPAHCQAMLDIGGGLGGVDILLSRLYSTPSVHILDGLEDPPVVRSHASTFNNASVTLDFLAANGVQNAHVYYPRPYPAVQYDLIVSFAAYCFHIPPTTYFDILTEMSHPGTVFIFDVRATKPLWLEQLCGLLGKPVLLERGKKHVRLRWTRG